MNSAESSRGPVSDSRRPPVKVRGPRSYGWRDLYNLSFLVSSNLTQTGRQQEAQLRDSGEATPQHVPKALSAEPQAGGGSSVLSLLCAKDQTNETVSTNQIFSKFSRGLRRGFLGTFFPLLFPPVLQLSPGTQARPKLMKLRL